MALRFVHAIDRLRRRACGVRPCAARLHAQTPPPKKDDGFQTTAPYAILMDADTGTVLFERNADKVNPPASMSKLMTTEVVLHAIAEGKLKYEDEMTISENAWRKGGAPSGGSAMFAALNSRVSVRDLLHGVMIQSGNDACIALAEGIAGSELAFADMMNKRARELGLTQSNFTNSTGLHDPAAQHDGARTRQARAAHHQDLSGGLQVSTPSANSPGTRCASRTAIRCSRWASGRTG